MMATLPPDPLEPGGIKGFGERLRSGATTIEAATGAYLARIRALEPSLGAFEYVAASEARSTAGALDRLLAAGTDLGPLMGVAVAVKDLFAVDGMPTTVGSNLDLADVVGPEGSFVKALKRAGCVILGKTRMPEFAMGGGRGGFNPFRGTPWNPWDAGTQRAPGGSSSGSAVAVAAGLCGLAVGSDTGGSVRVPAAFCGVFGFKPTVGLWPLDGAFPGSRLLDTVGPLTASAADAAVVFGALTGQPPPSECPPRGLRLGRPMNYFFEELDPAVEKCIAAALAAIADAGVEIVAVEVPEAADRDAFFPTLLAAELIAVLGRDRYLASRHLLDPVVEAQVSCGLEVLADEYIRLVHRHLELCRVAQERMAGLDGWVCPTTGLIPWPLGDFVNPEGGPRLAAIFARNTRPGNLFGLCATTTPIQALGSAWPVGLQVLGPPGADSKVLSIARILERLVGLPPRPDLSGFLERKPPSPPAE